MSKEVWAILILFFIFIFGLPLMSYVNITSGKMQSLHGETPEVALKILEEKKAILKAEHEKQLAENMGKEGAKFVNEQFNWERVAKNFLDIIKPYVDTK